MEKYSKWRDPATGIHPFVPVNHSRHAQLTIVENWLYHVVLIFAGLLLFCVRVPLLVLTLFSWTLCSVLFWYLPVVASTANVVFARVVLFIFGFYWISLKSFSIKKSTLTDQAATFSQSRSSFHYTFNPSDWIISNHTSYIDYLVYIYLFSPTLTEICPTLPFHIRETSLCKIFQTLLTKTFLSDETNPSSGWIELNGSFKGSKIVPYNRPWLVFPERVTTNGRALIQFEPIFDHPRFPFTSQRFFLAAIKYKTHLNPTINGSPIWTVGSVWSHLLRLLWTSHYQPIQVSIVPVSDYHYLESSGSGKKTDFLAHLMSTFTRLKYTSLNWKNKSEFLNFYSARHLTKSYHNDIHVSY